MATRRRRPAPSTRVGFSGLSATSNGVLGPGVGTFITRRCRDLALGVYPFVLAGGLGPCVGDLGGGVGSDGCDPRARRPTRSLGGLRVVCHAGRARPVGEMGGLVGVGAGVRLTPTRPKRHL